MLWRPGDIVCCILAIDLPAMPRSDNLASCASTSMKRFISNVMRASKVRTASASKWTWTPIWCQWLNYQLPAPRARTLCRPTAFAPRQPDKQHMGTA